MKLNRRHLALLLMGAGTSLVLPPLIRLVFAHPSTHSTRSGATVSSVEPSAGSGWPEPVEGQDQAPNRSEFNLVARNYRYNPDRLEVTQDDLVRLTIRSEDFTYSFAIDEYRIVRRVPAGETTTFEFRADRAGTFRFYSNLTGEGGHADMQGQLVVRAR
jgi:heme/copper-type cytochrome/quinol oxidase subunit 2